MKRTILQIWLAVGLAFGLAAAVQAQSSAEYRAHIPFDFNVGNTEFKAGDYRIGLVNPQTSRQALAIREANGRGSKIFVIRSKDSNACQTFAKLIFSRYENQYFLSEMNTSTLGAEFMQSKTEKNLARRQKSKQETIAILK